MRNYLPVLILLSVFFSSNVFADDPVVICFDSQDEWAPYFYVKDEEFKGANVETIKLLFKKIDQKFEIKVLPWPRILSSIKTFPDMNGCEMAWGREQSKSRAEFMLFSIPIYRLTVGAFYSKKFHSELNFYRTMFNVFSYNVCGIRGYSYFPVDSAIKIRLSNTQQALNLLDKGRCDLFVSTHGRVVYGGKLGFLNLPEKLAYMHAPKVFSRDVYVAVSKGSPRAKELISKINDTISEMRRSGELEKIFKKYVQNGTGLSK